MASSLRLAWPTSRKSRMDAPKSFSRNTDQQLFSAGKVFNHGFKGQEKKKAGKELCFL